MKLSLTVQFKLGAVLVTALAMLGCQGPNTNAGDEVPRVSSAASAAVVASTVATNPIVSTNALAEQPLSAAAIVPPDGATSPKPVALSDRLQDVVKLAQSGVGDDVILAFVKNSAEPFNPTPEQIVYLTDLGLSDVVITALVNHRAGSAEASASTPAPVATAPAQAPAVVQAPVSSGPNLVETNAAIVAPTYNPEPQVVYSTPPVVQYTAPAPVVDNSYFYSSLSPYGTWVEVSDYGVCWQPSVAIVDPGWRPYCHRGRWIYSDCGWYWQSDYSWGWAPFHYGRWFHHPARGWCWRPGDVWAPAWVSWRYSDAHCGWAPLPPGARYSAGVGFTYYGAHVGVDFSFGLGRDCWTFVPVGRMHDREIWRHRLGPDRINHEFRHSRVVNNYVVNNNVIVNQGLDRRHVPALARTEVPKVSVRELPDRPSAGVRPDRVRQEGAQAVVYRPKSIPVSNRGNVNPGSGIQARPAPVANVGSRTEPAPTVGVARPTTRTLEGSGNVTGTRGPATPSVVPGATPRTFERTPAVTAPAQTTPSVATRSEPQPNRVGNEFRQSTPQTFRVPTSPTPAVRSDTARSWSVPAASTPAPQVSQPAPVQRQETPRVQEAVQTPTRSFRTPSNSGVSTWNQSGSSANPVFERRSTQVPAVNTPAPVYRQEVPAPSVSVAPERVAPQRVAPRSVQTWSQPNPGRAVVNAPSQPNVAPAPSFRSVPTYTPPARSFEAPPQRSAPVVATPTPVQRSAPQAVGNPNAAGRSGNRQQN